MQKTYIKKNNGLYVAGKVLTIIEYVFGIVTLSLISIMSLVFAGIWQTIPAIADEVPAEYVDMMSLIFLVVGISLLVFFVPFIILGAIAIKKIKNAEEKKDLLPWAIVTLIFISVIPGVLLILSSTLPMCQETIDVQ